jgi:hypothetical protein
MKDSIQLRPAQKKRAEKLLGEFERAKTALDGFMEYVVEDLEVPEGWTLNDLNVGFVPGRESIAKGGEPNPYKAPAADAVEEARPFA